MITAWGSIAPPIPLKIKNKNLEVIFYEIFENQNAESSPENKKRVDEPLR
jgi:hypothetical protein